MAEYRAAARHGVLSGGGAALAVIGLGVMGRNLALNLIEHGYRVVVHDQAPGLAEQFVAGAGRGAGALEACTSPAALMRRLRQPRVVLLLVPAGAAVDAAIAELRPLLAAGDILVDLGNSHFGDSERRAVELGAHDVRFVASGISGGAEGARHGPSLMPSGDAGAWQTLRAPFEAIAARVDGAPCVTWIGPGGAGHFVKMVHNGIEYGDMQLLCEAYDLLRRGLGLGAGDISTVFRHWNEGVLQSYLVEITGDILARREDSGAPLIEAIVDRAGQKGTGMWSAIEALHLGVPVPLLAEAVYARCLSALRNERLAAAAVLPGPTTHAAADALAGDLEQALHAAKIVSYAQGFMLLRAASHEYGWDLPYGRIAAIWRGGCIIRSRFLDEVTRAFETDGCEQLLLAPFFCEALAQAQQAWRSVVAHAVALGVPVPALASALSFYDGLRSARLPANLLQAQRDYFGAHGFERLDGEPGELHHADWHTPQLKA